MSVIIDGILRSQEDPQLRVRQVAEHVCEGLDARDYLSEALAFSHFVEASCRYFRDPRTVELVKAPYICAGQILSGTKPQLDCDDMASLVGALALSGGARVRITCGAFRNAFFKGERQFSHVWCEVQEPKTNAWITCDPVAGPGTKKMLDRLVAVRHWIVA